MGNKEILMLVLLSLLVCYTLVLLTTEILIRQSIYDKECDYYNYKNIDILGIWRLQTSGEKVISFVTNNRTIENLLNTSRHEICHEIYSKVVEEDNYSSIASEEFARICNPEDYLDV